MHRVVFPGSPATIGKYALTLLAVGFLASADVAQAELTLHGMFTDHAVLQRGMPILVWGTSDAGAEVAVSLGDKKAAAKAGKDGRWQVEVESLEAGGPYVLSVRQGDNAVQVKDVFVGEVWLCSGQSNMAWKVSRATNAKQEVADAKHPQIRMFNVPRSPSAQPQQNVKGNWQVCSPQTVAGFSATAYFFGRALHKELGVPVGLINSSVGGTPIEAWTSLETHKTSPQLQPVLKQPKDGAGKGPAELYNGMIAPLAPYAVRGAIWYQGERNSKIGEPFRYRHQLPAMIGNWRTLWNRQAEQFPFLFVQLPNFMPPQKQPVESNGWVTVREGMLATLKSVPNTGMAVTVDIGEAGNIHPANKQDVGGRLARWALATTYGQDDLVAGGPIYKSHSVENGRIAITFDHTGGQLSAKGGGDLRGFAIAGEDRKFVFAQAKIDGNRVTVSSPQVKKPVAVRYAWASNPACNLVNKAGLPASPFRTDDWE